MQYFAKALKYYIKEPLGFFAKFVLCVTKWYFILSTINKIQWWDSSCESWKEYILLCWGCCNQDPEIKSSSDANLLLLCTSSSNRNSKCNRMRFPGKWGWRKNWTRRWSSCMSTWRQRWGTSKLWICRVKGPKRSSRDWSSSWKSWRWTLDRNTYSKWCLTNWLIFIILGEDMKCPFVIKWVLFHSFLYKFITLV